MATLHNRSSVALGNIVGSNIFNITAIMGTTIVIMPISVGPHIITIDMWVMLMASALVWLLVYRKILPGRWVGTGMILTYTAYILQAFMF